MVESDLVILDNNGIAVFVEDIILITEDGAELVNRSAARFVRVRRGPTFEYWDVTTTGVSSLTLDARGPLRPWP